jgi:translation initiation factor IF-2
MSKVRVYEVARQLNMDQKALVALFQSMGLTDVKNHMSAVDPDAVERVKRQLDKAKAPPVVEERIRPTVVKRRAAARPPDAPPSRDVAAPPEASPSRESRDVREARDSRDTREAPASAPSASVTETPVVAVPAERKSRASARKAVAPAPAEAASEQAAPVIVSAPPAAAPSASKKPKSPAVPAELLAGPEAAAPAATPAAAAPAATPSAPAAEKIAPEAAAKVAPEPVVTKEAAAAPPTPAPVAPAEAPAAPAAAAPAAAASEQAVTAVTEKRVPATPTPPPSRNAQRPPPPVEPPPAPRPAAAASSAPAPSTAPSTTTEAPARPAGGRPSAPPKTGIEVWGGRPGVPMPAASMARSAPTQRRVEYNMRGAPGGLRPGQPPPRPGQMPSRPGMGGPMGRGPGGRGRPGQQNIRRGPVAVSTKEMSAEKKIIKIEEKVSLQTLAARMSLKATEVLMKLIQMGMPGVHINTPLDADTAKIVAGEFGWEVEDVAVSEEDQLSLARGPETEATEGTEVRAPIVTVMGHVDHGKTSLLDQIRKANVASGEAGGITQHIGAYRVATAKGPITFLDTPGHEAFTQMRARGAGITDIVVLVVAADDGVMPQTREAVNHARAAKVPIIVAVNKCDKPDADPEKVKRQLMDLGLVSEDLGGDTIYVPVSAKTRMGIDELLEMIAVQAEVLELRADSTRPGRGTVVEALLDRGKGPVARIIVTDGTLRPGDFVLAGPAFGKIRAMTDEHGRQLAEAGPSTPVEVLGLADVPNVGDTIDAVKDNKKAQEIAEGRRLKAKASMPATTKVTLEDLARMAQNAGQLELRVIIKGDVQGSVEALQESLVRLSGEKVKLSVIMAGVGAITEGDVNLAIASRAIIIGFGVRPAGKAGQLAETEGIEIRQYNIIYNVVDDIRGAMEGLLAPTLVEKPVGKAEVRVVFKLSRAGVIAGSMVIEGTMKRNLKARVFRGKDVVYEGKIVSLKRIKEDVKEVSEGYECGIGLDDFDTMQEGDIVQAIEIEEVRTRL